MGKDGMSRGTYSEIVEAVELGRLHDCVEHGLHDKADVVHNLVFGDVKTHERLQKSDKHDEEEQEKDERLAEHNLKDDEHGAEEAESIEVEEQTHPEHGRCEGKEVVTELVEASTLLIVLFVANRNYAEYERHRKKCVQGAVEHVPEGDVETADLPELVDLVANET
jgi:hypothetical protein